MNANQLITRLMDLIVKSYNDGEFGGLLQDNLHEVEEADFDYGGLLNTEFKKKVHETVMWANRYGQLKTVLWLTQKAAAKRPEWGEYKILIVDIKKVVNAPEDALASAGDQSKLPASLVATFGVFESKQLTLEQFATDLRPILRAQGHASCKIPEQFHLSDLDWKRVVAILALEAEPDPNYIRWLAERVTVERPYPGFLATQALVTSAFRLSREHLKELSKVIRDAINRLSLQSDDPDHPSSALYNRKHELDVANELAMMRTGAAKLGMNPDDLDRFLKVLSKLRSAELDDLCQKASGAQMKYLGVRSVGPPELIAVAVVVKARQNNWEPELIKAAFSLLPTDVVILDVHKRYAGVV